MKWLTRWFWFDAWRAARAARIRELWAWVAPTAEGPAERIIWSQIGPVMTMLVTSDRGNLPKLREAAEIFVQQHGRPARLLHITGVRVRDVITPPEGAQ